MVGRGRIGSAPGAGAATVRAMFWFDEDVRFTHLAWRGRMRACHGVGAALDEQQVAAFDAEHAALLATLAPDPFTVRHRVDAHVLDPHASAPMRGEGASRIV